MRPARYEPEDIWALHGPDRPGGGAYPGQKRGYLHFAPLHPGADAFKSAL